MIELVCLHGSPGVPAEFGELMRYVKSANVTAPVRKGYPGYRPVPFEGRIVLGYSWGAVDALLSAANEQTVRGVVLVAPYLFPEKPAGPVKRLLLQLPVLSDVLLKKIGGTAIPGFIEKSCAPDQVPEAYRAVASALREPAVLRRAILEKDPGREVLLSAMAQLAERKVPVLVIIAGEDKTSDESRQIAPLREMFTALREKSIPHSGHAVPWTHPRELAAAIDEFIQGNPKNEFKEKL